MNSIWAVMVPVFLVLDPVGNVPIVVAMLKRYDVTRQRQIILRESLFALAVMTVFLFFGPVILRVMGVGQNALSMTGGVVIFLIGLHMSFPSKESFLGETDVEKEPLLVPLAIPLIAGPGVLGMVMLTAQRADNLFECLAALVCAWAASTLILYLSNAFSRVLGVRGMEACQRLMGLALTAMAVQMFMTGFKIFMKS
ncbi:MAG: MarC family protein [bacterium]